MPVFGTLGLSGVGLSLASSFSEYRNYFLAITLIMLGLAHYLLYAKSNLNPWNKRVVWAATLLAVVLLAYSPVNLLLLHLEYSN